MDWGRKWQQGSNDMVDDDAEYMKNTEQTEGSNRGDGLTVFTI